MFKKILAIGLLGLALASCDTGPKPGADNYTFGTKQYERSSVQINIVTYKTQQEIAAAAKARGVDSPDIVAFSVLKPPFDTCTVHMIDPAVKYEPEYVGHEFLHCVYGQWHTSNKDFS